jgi:predicted neuraminidase
MMIDRNESLWLFWPTIMANTWESCLTRYRVTNNYLGTGAPKWAWQGTIFLQPKNFQEKMLAALEQRVTEKETLSQREQRLVDFVRKTVPEKLSARLGWQPRCKPIQLPSGRILLPLYTDTFSVSIMAISDDNGETWFAGEPLVGYGNIQPTLLRRDDGTIVAYMRENGPVDRIRVCQSADDGVTWGAVGATQFPNPGSGLDGIRLAGGHWLLVYNDTLQGRRSLAVSLSEDEGKTWPWTRHLEHHESGSYHYPAVTQAADGTIHFVYSFFVTGGKSMKHAAVNEEWVRAGGD